MKLIMSPDIAVKTGGFLDYLHPTIDAIDIEDIAEGLAKCCRYAGQCKGFYSVAEHSVEVSYKVPPELALQALLHDATEAYMGDMTSPLKQLIPEYKVIEKRLAQVIYNRFGVDVVEHPLVQEADYRMFVTEYEQLFEHQCDFSVEPYPNTNIHGLEWKEAKELFLGRFNELYAGREVNEN